MYPDIKPVTAYSTSDSYFKWKVLPLGIKTTGGVFQRMMDQILRGLQPRCVAVYINDITVYSPDVKQHQRDLEGVFRQLKAALLRVSVSKNRLSQVLILVLGLQVSAQGIKPNPNNFTAILQITEPTSVSEIKRFMRIIDTYQR